VRRVLRIAAVPLAAIALFLAVARVRRSAVPETPGAVVEHFLDHVAQGRYERAATLLSPDLRGSEAPAAVERWKAEAVRGLGEIRDVRGETEWISGTDGLLLGLAVALAAPTGDLFESLIKRDMGTKDTGTLFGAHGGALDRVDAAIFAIVAGYYVWLAVA